MRRFAAWLLFGALVLAPPCLAAEAADITIVGDESPELARQLRAEIAYAGFVPVDAGLARETPASLRVLSAERVQLSVQRPSDATRFEQTLTRRPAEGEFFALRVVEALRARLVDVGWTVPAASGAEARSSSGLSPSEAAVAGEPAADPSFAGAVASEADVTTPAAARQLSASSDALRLWLGAGVTGAWSFGGLGVSPHAALTVRADGADWAAALAANLPLTSAELNGAEGEAEVSWSAFTAAVERRLPLPWGWLGGLGLGAGLLVVDARGEPRGDFSGQRERLACGAGFAQLSLARELNGWLRLRATATGGATAPRPVLRFDGREVASLGRGYATLGVALELAWPEADEGAP